MDDDAKVFKDTKGTNVLFIYMQCNYVATLTKEGVWEVRHWPMDMRSMGRDKLSVVDPRVITEAKRRLALHMLTT